MHASMSVVWREESPPWEVEIRRSGRGDREERTSVRAVREVNVLFGWEWRDMFAVGRDFRRSGACDEE